MLVEHVEIAARAEGLAEPLELLPEMGDPARLEHVAHGAEHGAQPPDGGAHLVNLLGVAAESDAGLGVPQRVDLLAQECDDALPGFTAGGDRNLLDGQFRRHHPQHRTVREKSRRISTARRAVALAPAGSYNRSMASLTPERKTALRREMESLLGKGAVLSDPDELLVYESDGLTLFRALADFVVFPQTAEHVAALVRLANREGMPFVARGAGTGLSGGCLPAEGGLVISLMRMNRVLEIDYANQFAVVEPGLVNLHLSWAVGPNGFYYAPDPSSQQACTIGGNIANNSGGPHTLKYGVTTNHVLGLEVVMPDGELMWIGGKTRDPQGYDLTGSSWAPRAPSASPPRSSCAS
jgi:hypothetical protein